MTVQINATMLRVLLAKQDLDQTDLAEKSGVSRRTIIRLMQGEAFSSETLGKIAGALGVNPIDLIESEGYPNPLVGAQADAMVQ